MCAARMGRKEAMIAVSAASARKPQNRSEEMGALCEEMGSAADAAGAQRPTARHLKAIATRRDQAAFVTLFDFYAPRVKAYMKRLGATDDVAEELVQEVMLAVWRKAGSYDPAKAAVSTWIFTI